MGALIAALGTSCATSSFRGDTGIRAFGFDLWDVHCPSGLRVIFERTPGSPVAGVTAVVGVGSRHDPVGREGLAHVVEHLAFRSHAEGEAAVDQRLSSLGATSNAHTAFDETTYFAFTAAGSLRALLTLEGRLLVNPVIGLDEGTFAVERDVVRNELRQRNETDASGFGFDGVEHALFPPSHPYARPIIGSHASLSAITLDDARSFASEHYRPAEMTLLVVGDIDLTHAEDLVRETLPAALYGDASQRRPVVSAGARLSVAVPLPEPPAPPSSLPQLQAAISTPELWIAWTAPGGFGADRFVAGMWTSVASSNFNSGRFSDPDIAGVRFFVFPQSLATVVACRVSLTDGNHPDRSLAELISSLPWVGGDEIYLDARFRHLKAWALSDLAFSAERASHRSQERAMYAHFTGSLGYYGETVSALQSIGADEARDFATKYLAPARARAVLLRPLDATASVARTTLATRDTAAQSGPDPLPAPTVANLAAVKHLRALHRVTLPSGLETVIAPRAGAPVITASLGLHGGRAAGAPGVGLAFNHAVEFNFEESPGDFGIELQFDSEADLTTASVRAGAANLPRALDMLLFALRSYDIEWPSDKFKTAVLPHLRRQEKGPLAQFERSYRHALFGEHPYGRVPTPDEVAGAKKGDISSWIERSLALRNAVLVIAGDITPAEAEAAARDTLGSWRAGGDVIPAPPPFAARDARGADATSALAATAAFAVTHRPGATQGVLRLGCLLPPSDARVDAVRDVAAQVVANDLEHQLRHQTGATYGVSVTSTPFRGSGAALEVAAAIDNEKLGPALRAIRNYWAELAGGQAATPRDLEIARGGLASGRLLAYERSASITAALLMAWNQGWPLDASDRYADYLASTTVGEINETLAACARTTTAALLGDGATIRAALQVAATPVTPPTTTTPAPPASTR